MGFLTKGRTVVLAAVVGGLAAAGIAYASIPDTDGMIHGCYQMTSGSLRVIGTDPTVGGGKCKPSEKALSWSVAGPKGATGVQGATGPAGPSGPSGPPGPNHPGDAYVVSRTALFVGTLSQAGTIVARLELPAGNYIVNGSVSLQNTDPTDASLVQCDIYWNGGDTALEVTEMPAGSASSLTVTGGWMRFQQPETVKFGCELGTHLYGATFAYSPQLSAIQVGSLSVDAE